MLPYWLALAPAYAAALAQPCGNDTSVLDTSVGYWPGTTAAQQALLHELFTASQLRQAWQRYCRNEQHQSSNEKQQALNTAMYACDTPLKEIALYHGWLCVSCQQLVCIPKVQWQVLRGGSTRYDPSQIDAQTVERLATRIAQIFNRSPLLPAELSQNGPSC